jgi:hypothetical protein
MGCTIFYKGETDTVSLGKILNYVKLMTKGLNWKYFEVDNLIATTSVQSSNTTFCLSIGRLFENAEKVYERGLRFHSSETYAESIDFVFVKYGDIWKIETWCKTNREPLTHQLLIWMLVTIKETWMPNLEIDDEGSFYIPSDPNEHEEWVNRFYPEYRDENRPKQAFNFIELAGGDWHPL